MSSPLTLIISSALVNNFVLVKFLGLCPVMGVSQKMDNAIGMSLATLFVLTLTACLSYLLQHYVLIPYELQHLQLISFIFTIATVVGLSELLMAHWLPMLHQVLGLYLPLITTNCAVLGVALITAQADYNLIEALAAGLGAGLGFALILIIFTSLRERLTHSEVPIAFQGTPIALITAGILSMAFIGFSGISGQL